MDREQIKKQAKQIMDDFVRALNKVDAEDLEVGIDRKNSVRASKGRQPERSEFRKLFFRNAPHKTEEYIVAEKKKW